MWTTFCDIYESCRDIDSDNKYRYTNSQLWAMAEQNKIGKRSVFEDSEGNQIIFTGKSFQLYYSDHDETKEYIGMCVGDTWEFIGTYEEMI